MNKYLIYTSNPDVMPKGMDDVLKFAESAHKYYFAKVKAGSRLANVGKGDHIISSKGNNLYVIEALKTADTKLIESYERRGMKRMNIKDADKVQIVAFASWCKTAHGIAASIAAKEASGKTSKTTKNMKNSLTSIASRIKEMYTPQEVDDVRIAQDGNLCVETAKGWVTIGADGKLRAYPEELTFGGLPVFAISKPVAQLQAGDVISLDNSYAKVISYNAETGTIKAKSYTGSKKTVYTIEDVVFGQSTIKVLVNLAGNQFAGGINPMMLSLLNKKENGEGGLKSLLPLILMGQNGGANGINPMMLALLSDDGDTSLKDILMMQAFAGNNGANPFAGLFSGFGAAPQAAAPAAEEAED
jgi:hypothetical protein